MIINFITTEELSEMIGVSVVNIRKKRQLIASGDKDKAELPAPAFKRGNVIFYSLKEVKKWKRSSTTKKHVS